MRVVGFPAGVFQTNCYIVSADDGTCVVVDPGQDAAGVVRAHIAEAGLRPRAVLATHGHLDHVWNAREVADHYGVPCYIHPADRFMLTSPGDALSIDISTVTGGEEFREPETVVELFDGDHLEFGPLVFDVDHVPGHSPGSVALRTVDDSSGTPQTVVFGGDVLFQDGIGRTDLPGGDAQELLESIAKKLLVLEDDAVVLPGHGPATTVGRERRQNPFLPRD